MDHGYWGHWAIGIGAIGIGAIVIGHRRLVAVERRARSPRPAALPPEARWPRRVRQGGGCGGGGRGLPLRCGPGHVLGQTGGGGGGGGARADLIFCMLRPCGLAEHRREQCGVDQRLVEEQKGALRAAPRPPRRPRNPSRRAVTAPAAATLAAATLAATTLAAAALAAAALAATAPASAAPAAAAPAAAASASDAAPAAPRLCLQPPAQAARRGTRGQAVRRYLVRQAERCCLALRIGLEHLRRT